MKQYKWQITLAVCLVLLSLGSYLSQIVLFHRTEDTFFYMLQDFAFVPIQVILATMILNGLMARREKIAMLKKVNMVVGVFFSEVGMRLLSQLSVFDRGREDLKGHLLVSPKWSDRDFSSGRGFLRGCEYKMDLRQGDLEELRTFLIRERQFLLTLMENPNLLEHQSFTDMLLAVFHLSEELSAREGLGRLPEKDLDHLSGDIKRVYSALLGEWLGYMKHLKEEYPFLFSFMVRTNPFDPSASVEITK